MKPSVPIGKKPQYFYLHKNISYTRSLGMYILTLSRPCTQN